MEKLNPLIFVGGHPGVGKTEFARSSAVYFPDVKVVEFRDLLKEVVTEENARRQALRENAVKEGGKEDAQHPGFQPLRYTTMTTEQTRKLLPALARKLREERTKKTVLLLGHYVYPTKVPPKRASDHVDVKRDEYENIARRYDKKRGKVVHVFQPNAYVLLDANTRTLIERARKRKQRFGIGEWFLNLEPQRRETAVEQRRTAEAMESQFIARELNAPLHTLRTDLSGKRDIEDHQARFFELLLEHGATPYPLFEEMIRERIQAMRRRSKRR